MKRIIMTLCIALMAVLLGISASAACSHRNKDEKVTELPTCYSYGELEVTCADCGEFIKSERIKKEKHSLESKWTTTIEATCYREGEKQKACKNDGCDYVETEEIAKKKHSMPSTWETVKEATCYSDGLKQRSCRNEGCTYTEDKEIDMKDHDWSKWETERETTCYREGLRVRECENDGCGATDEEEIKKKSHSWTSWATTVEATCQLEGKKQRECKNDGCSEVEIDVIDKKSHSFTSWETNIEATCNEEGVKRRSCKNDGCSYVEDKEIEKKDHSFGSWKVTKDATCYAEGSKERSCKNCSYVENVVIKKTKHSYGSWVTIKEAYEDVDGLRSRECKVEECSEIQTEVVEIDCGDEYSYRVTVEATCTTSGTRTKICKNELSNGNTCGRNLGTETVKPSGHIWTNWKTVREATATQNGLESRTCKVKDCGAEEERKTNLGHGDSWHTKVTKEATCMEVGEQADICDCCQKPLRTSEIAKKSHTYDDAWTVTVVATPEKNGTRYKNCKTPGCTKQNIEYYPWSDETVPSKPFPFLDVKPNAWYKENVEKCYNHGLVTGVTETRYDSSGEITLAQVITLAVRIHCINNPDTARPDTTAKPWYKGYVDYAIENSIIGASDFADYNKPATRAEMAYIFASASDEDELEKINNYKSIPDVSPDHKYAEEIFLLYNAGVVEGNDEGHYLPDNNITRAESATIIARICNYASRKKSEIA